ncbi:MAG: hypothetical protein VXW65_11885 [Pseudomonadota bacterium]|nr:hypothetical protein [Pseudomonadota bacterium]
MNKKLWVAGALGLAWAFGVSSYINGQNKDQIDRSMAEYAEQRAEKSEEAARHARVRAESDAQNYKSQLEVAAKMAVRNSRKDPNSAVFRDVNGRCGLVNAKNGFGGYAGFKRYISNGDLVRVEGENATPEQMSEFWSKYCT